MHIPHNRRAPLALTLILALAAQAHAAAPVSIPMTAPPTAAASVAADELQQIATEAYLYAYPLVLMDVTRELATSVPAPTATRAPINQFAHVPVFPDADFTDVVRPNADTLYSILWYDVSKEPLLVRTPDSHGRYFLLEMLDMWSDVYSVPGTRTTGNGARQFAIVGPHWHGTLPAGVTPYRSPTDGGWIIGRTQTNGTADYPAVRQFQAGISATPLSAWNRPAARANGAAAAKADQASPPAASRAAPVQQVAAMDGATFFARYARLGAANPPHANDYPMLDRLARLGLAPGQPFDPERLAPAVRDALGAAPALARHQIARAMRQAGTAANGWRIILNPIGSYGTDYLRRAMIAFAGLGANPVEDAIYPFGLTDADGQPFDSAASYTIHFEPAQLPPVRAFWSLTLYNEQQFFAANPIKRYAIGDRDALSYNPDGSLDLLIQRAAPAPELQSNWLPAPASGSFSFNLRLYWPKPAALDGSWTPPPVRRLP
jgi:hypothetical protein